MFTSDLLNKISGGEFDEVLKDIYGDVLLARERYLKVINGFKELYGERDVMIFSAPGRSEIGGNHTDHQHGKVLACAIDLDIVCVVSFTDDNKVSLTSEGFGVSEVDLADLDPRDDEAGKSSAIIRGISKAFVDRGMKISGFRAYMVSSVLGGSGLSSSAAFESLIGTIYSKGLNDGRINDIEIAKIGQYAENIYFKKPCGLMDQMACSCGGFVYIDFADEPVVERIDFDLSKYGYTLCVVDTRGSHEHLTPEYAAIPNEMKMVARYFGKEYLNEIDENDFYSSIGELRKLENDRALLRAHHFLSENKRVPMMAEKLREGDIEAFFAIVKESGSSSYRYLQNVYASSEPHNQEVSLALALIERFLDGRGAYRVHGGGFAGTVQAYVPKDEVENFTELMESVFGKQCVYALNVRKQGGTLVIG
ncbi:MAG: galactokinase family protein [Erysipelotrichaceae bacterium]|nr:galactokinase [Solobacterium sp.]MDD6955463.1 galactokinase family protein [Solobacterium sp.]MDY2732091.1 galactokinase family protein [Erysipelotrichaceae bacterium]MDY5652135.1 galactokinase family protein [Erysipelotrichaceae bacterium]